MLGEVWIDGTKVNHNPKERLVYSFALSLKKEKTYCARTS